MLFLSIYLLFYGYTCVIYMSYSLFFIRSLLIVSLTIFPTHCLGYWLRSQISSFFVNASWNASQLLVARNRRCIVPCIMLFLCCCKIFLKQHLCSLRIAEGLWKTSGERTPRIAITYHWAFTFSLPLAFAFSLTKANAWRNLFHIGWGLKILIDILN